VPDSRRCPHMRKQFGRVLCADGRTQVLESCLDCGANARGPGVWVPRSELRTPPEDLPLVADYRRRPAPPGNRQGDLFAQE
jgi:hypothetical protein